MYYLFIALPIVFVAVTIFCFWYYYRHNKNKKQNITTEDVWLESLDMNKWRGGVRRRMDLVKTKEDFYDIKKKIELP